MSLPSQQKALLLPSFGPDAAYVLGTRAVPQPGPNEVLIRNKAVALNPLDVGIRLMGLYINEWPAVCGWDAVGPIVALGRDVQGWQVGDVVMYQGRNIPNCGCFQEYTLSNAAFIAKVPGNVSVEQAASVTSALVTATTVLYNKPSENSLGLTAPWKTGGLGKYEGQAALVIGGSSSVGQLGK